MEASPLWTLLLERDEGWHVWQLLKGDMANLRLACKAACALIPEPLFLVDLTLQPECFARATAQPRHGAEHSNGASPGVNAPHTSIAATARASAQAVEKGITCMALCCHNDYIKEFWLTDEAMDCFLANCNASTLSKITRLVFLRHPCRLDGGPMRSLAAALPDLRAIYMPKPSRAVPPRYAHVLPRDLPSDVGGCLEHDTLKCLLKCVAGQALTELAGISLVGLDPKELAKFPTLECLRITDLSGTSAESFGKLMATLPKLRRLSLPSLTDALTSSLFAAWPPLVLSLEQLELHGCYALKGLQHMFRKCPRLERLSLDQERLRAFLEPRDGDSAAGQGAAAAAAVVAAGSTSAAGASSCRIAKSSSEAAGGGQPGGASSGSSSSDGGANGAVCHASGWIKAEVRDCEEDRDMQAEGLALEDLETVLGKRLAALKVLLEQQIAPLAAGYIPCVSIYWHQSRARAPTGAPPPPPPPPPQQQQPKSQQQQQEQQQQHKESQQRQEEQQRTLLPTVRYLQVWDADDTAAARLLAAMPNVDEVMLHSGKVTCEGLCAALRMLADLPHLAALTLDFPLPDEDPPRPPAPRAPHPPAIPHGHDGDDGDEDAVGGEGAGGGGGGGGGGEPAGGPGPEAVAGLAEKAAVLEALAGMPPGRQLLLQWVDKVYHLQQRPAWRRSVRKRPPPFLQVVMGGRMWDAEVAREALDAVRLQLLQLQLQQQWWGQAGPL